MRRVPSARLAHQPASFSTFRCCETAGRLTGSPRASSPTGRGPRATPLEDCPPGRVAQGGETVEGGGLGLGHGGYFGARLAAAGHDVAFIARGAHLDAIRARRSRRREPRSATCI